MELKALLRTRHILNLLSLKTDNSEKFFVSCIKLNLQLVLNKYFQ